MPSWSRAQQRYKNAFRWKPLHYRRTHMFKWDVLRKRHGPIVRRGPPSIREIPRWGVDPLEARAVPISQVYGSLEERIVYKELLRRKEVFDFQSSMAGGRVELGGLVADFVLPLRKVVLQVHGTIWHTGLEQETKDKLQELMLEKEGYTVWVLWDWQIRDQELFEEWMNRHLGRAP